MTNSTKTYFCETCGSESKRLPQKFNKYCSNRCAGEGKLKETMQRFLQGQVHDRNTLRRVLTEIRGYACEVCGISEYNDRPLTLQVDHVDGNAGDSNPKNVRLICPNCHSQTKTFGGGNKGNGRAARGLPLN